MISALTFFRGLKWIDGTPLQIEPYREELFRKSLDTYRDDGVPQYTLVLAGRGKKNSKSLDLILAGLFVLMCRESAQNSDALIVANDLDQANQDLDLAKKLVRVNGLGGDDGELEILAEEIRRRDGKGTMRILPANNVIGQHGKTAAFLGYDEIHAYKNHDLFEALAVDPTRHCLVWITSYDTIDDVEGQPLHDFKQIGIAGTDDRMLFSWYSGDLCTDPAFANLEPELRANPSIGSWPEGRGYLKQQRSRLPSSKFRRLHLNLPGAVSGAFFDQDVIERAIVPGRQEIPPQDGMDYLAFVDMSGGSNDDAVLAISHWDGQKAVLDLLINQGDVPGVFNPRLAVARFAVYCKRYRCREVHGDAYGGQTFRFDFSDLGVDYTVTKKSKTDIYEDAEVAANAGQIELLDIPKLHRELLTIVQRGASVDHMPGRHDDWANAACGALTLANPDIDDTTPNMLLFYQRQAEANVASAAPPTLQSEHAGAAVMQIGTRRPAGFVKVAVAGEPSHIFGISGVSYLVEIEDGQRIVWMALDDAKAQVGSSLNLPFFEANTALRARLGAKPTPSRGIRWSDLEQAAEDAQPVDPTDLGRITNQTFAMLRRAR